MTRLILPFLAMILYVAGDSTYVGEARSYDHDEICFDLPQGVVDWYDLAVRSLGAETVKQPSREELVQHYFEPGAVSVLDYRERVSREVSDRNWLILHETGYIKSSPETLRGQLQFSVDRNYNVLGEPLAFGEACFRAREPGLRAAFVLGGTMVRKWSREPAFPVNGRSGIFYIDLSGQRYHFENPSFAVPRIKNVVVFHTVEESTMALAVWESDPLCERGCCEFAYSLYRLDANGATELIDENGYGCDV